MGIDIKRLNHVHSASNHLAVMPEEVVHSIHEGPATPGQTGLPDTPGWYANLRLSRPKLLLKRMMTIQSIRFNMRLLMHDGNDVAILADTDAS